MTTPRMSHPRRRTTPSPRTLVAAIERRPDIDVARFADALLVLARRESGAGASSPERRARA